MIDRPKLVEQLLQQGASPNALSTPAETPLSVAVQTGTVELIRRLLEAGADVGLGDPLHYAIEREADALEVVRLLLHRNTPVNTIQFAHPSARQWRHSLTRGTPLHKGCHVGKYEVVAEVLLKHDANTHSARMRESQAEQTTPLDIAKQREDNRMITLLETFRPDSRL